MIKILLAAITVVILAIWFSNSGKQELPEIDLDFWWGPGTKKDVDTSIRPFRITFTDSMLTDLKYRLSHFREPPSSLEGVNLEYGMNSDLLKKVVKHWTTKYNFAEREKFLNKFPQFKTNVQGLDVHFIHVKPENPKNKPVLPLLMLHGWPGSVREFYDVIPLLTKPRDDLDFVVELIVPSLPGYGFSDAPVRSGLGSTEVGVVMRNLMRRLGHQKFYIQGGDWGAAIGTSMVTVFEEEILGFHTNMPTASTKMVNFLTLIGSIYPPLIVEEKLADRMYPLSNFIQKLLLEFGYMHLQATKPDSVGTALTDSPAGLASYILEKFAVWTDPKSTVLPDAFTLDSLIDNLMFYWVERKITPSMRLYAESFNKRHFGLGIDEIPTKVPTWCVQAKNEVAYQPPTLLKYKFYNLLNCTVLNEGGHFLAMELPKIFSEDVLKGLKAFRSFKRN